MLVVMVMAITLSLVGSYMQQMLEQWLLSPLRRSLILECHLGSKWPYRSVYVINFHSVYGKLVLEAHRSLGRVVLSQKSLQSSGMVSFDYQFGYILFG